MPVVGSSRHHLMILGNSQSYFSKVFAAVIVYYKFKLFGKYFWRIFNSEINQKLFNPYAGGGLFGQ